MLEFYHDFIDKFFDRRDFELIQMDTDSMYMASSDKELDNLVKPELKKEYSKLMPQFLARVKEDPRSKRTPGLLKMEFQGTRMIALASKCYYADNEGDDEASRKEQKASSKGVKKNQNQKTWDHYEAALGGYEDRANNVGFRRDGDKMITYNQEKLGLSAYYDKRVVLEDKIHTKNLF